MPDATLGELAQLPSEVSLLRDRIEQLEQMIETYIAVPRLLTISAFARIYPEWTVGQLRWILFKRRSNGFAPAVIEGDPLRIDVVEFIRIVRERGRITRRRKRRPS
jgi:hypothetical protein